MTLAIWLSLIALESENLCSEMVRDKVDTCAKYVKECIMDEGLPENLFCIEDYLENGHKESHR